MSTAITITPQAQALSITETRRSTQQMVAQRAAIVEAMQKVMRKDVDYGTIQGTPKPTLYKPGSEKILSMFNLAAKPTVEDLSTPDTIRYRVHIEIVHIPTGNILGVGVGEASSAESKYQWRAAVCDEEWDETPEDRRRNKWKRGGGGSAYAVRQIRADMEDIANTVLKMAKKRAQIDGVLTVTAASDVFSQDIEELVDNGVDTNPDADPPSGYQQPQQRPEELQRRTDAAPAQQQRQQPAAQPANRPASGGPLITPEQARLWWAKAMGTHNDHKVLMAFLRDRMGVGNKDFIPAARWKEALDWAEGRSA